MKIAKFAWLFLGLVLTCSCAKHKENYFPLSFEVQDSLLTVENIVLGDAFSFRVPQTWVSITPLPQELQKANITQHGCTVIPTYYFSAESIDAVVVASEIAGEDLSSSVTSYVTGMYKQCEPGTCTKNCFSHNGLKFDQLISSVDGYVRISLIVHDAEFHFGQFDYLIKQENYFNVSKAIESSIGSINQKKGV